MRKLLKTMTFAVLVSPPLTKARLRRLVRGGQLTILNFHRVAPDDSSAYPPLAPNLFEDVICFCKRHFRLITFGDLDDYKPAAKPPLIISFDDGYRDFAEHAVPILKRHGVRCNHNIIPGCVNAGTPPFNVVLQDYIGRAPDELLWRLNIPGFRNIRPREARGLLGMSVSRFVKNKPIAEQKELAETVMPQLMSMDGFAPTPMMSRADLKVIGDSHELGAHSFEHATLACETDDYVRKDAKACQRWFKDALGRSTDIYTLPNGEGSPHHIELIRAAGYRHVLQVGEDYSSVGATTHQRFTMYGSSRSEVRFRATGFRRP